MNRRNRFLIALLSLGLFSSPSLAQTSASKPAEVNTSGIVVLKDLLKGLPKDDRVEFMLNLTLSAGTIVSVYTAPLKRSRNKGQVTQILDALAGTDSPPSNGQPKSASAPPMRLADVLQGVPEAVRNEFLDSLSFKDGSVVSAHVGALKRAVGDKKTVEILALLAPPIEGVPGKEPKGLCGNGWCDDSACTAVNSAPLSCQPRTDWRCRSTCR